MKLHYLVIKALVVGTGVCGAAGEMMKQWGTTGTGDGQFRKPYGVAVDSAGNVYADGVSQAQTTDGHQTHIFYARNIKGAATTVTAAFSATNNHPFLAIYEYAGLSTTSPLDQVAHAQGSGTSVSSGLTPTTTSSTELIFAGLGMANNTTVTVTAGSGYTMLLQDTGTSRAASEGKTSSATGQFAGTFTLSGSTNWSAVVATFK